MTMFCRICDRDMNFVTCSDDPKEDYSYNVYRCFVDDLLAVEHVWSNKCIIWIYPDSRVYKEIGGYEWPLE